MPAQAGIQYAAASQSSTTASGYWIIRFSRMMTAVFVGDHQNQHSSDHDILS
jgi:hypothetical protein